MIEVKIEAINFKLMGGKLPANNEKYLEVAEDIASDISLALSDLSGVVEHGEVRVYLHDPSVSEPWRLVATTGD